MAQPEVKSTILYVEDNPDNRMLVKRILTAENYKLLEATNAVQAINLLETTTPDLILMDINMPDMDGYTLTTRIRSMPGLARNYPFFFFLFFFFFCVFFFFFFFFFCFFFFFFGVNCQCDCRGDRKKRSKPAVMATFKSR